MTDFTTIHHLHSVARSQFEVLTLTGQHYFGVADEYQTQGISTHAISQTLSEFRIAFVDLTAHLDPMMNDFQEATSALASMEVHWMTLLAQLNERVSDLFGRPLGLEDRSMKTLLATVDMRGRLQVVIGAARVFEVILNELRVVAPMRERQVVRGDISQLRLALQDVTNVLHQREPTDWRQGLEEAQKFLEDPAIGEAEVRVLVRSIHHWLMQAMFAVSTSSQAARDAVKEAAEATQKIREILRMQNDAVDPIKVPSNDLARRAAGRFAASLDSATAMTAAGRLRREMAEARKQRSEPLPEETVTISPEPPATPSRYSEVKARFRESMAGLSAEHGQNAADVTGRPVFDFDEWVTPGHVIEGMAKWASSEPAWTVESVSADLAAIEAPIPKLTLSKASHEQLQELGQWARYVALEESGGARLEAPMAPHWYRMSIPDTHKFRNWRAGSNTWERLVQSSVHPRSIHSLRYAIAKTVLYIATTPEMSLERVLDGEPNLAVRLRGKLGKSTIMALVRRLCKDVAALFDRGPNWPQGASPNLIGFDSRVSIPRSDDPTSQRGGFAVTWFEELNRDPSQVRFDQIPALFELIDPMLKDAHHTNFGKEHRTKLDALEIWVARAKGVFERDETASIGQMFESQAQQQRLAEWESAAATWARGRPASGLERADRHSIGHLQVAFGQLYNVLLSLHRDLQHPDGVPEDIYALYDETLWIDFIYDGEPEEQEAFLEDEIESLHILKWCENAIRSLPGYVAQENTPLHTKLSQRLMRVLDSRPFTDKPLSGPLDPGDYVPPGNDD